MRLLLRLLWSCAAGALIGSLTATVAGEPVWPFVAATAALTVAAVALRRKAVRR
jgi:hypothetical protein